SVIAKSSSELLVTLEGISNREQARRLLNMPVWLQQADFEKHAAKSAPISLLGFHIIDGEHDLGPIREVIEQEHQILCTILYKGKEAMIPLHEESLIKTDKKNKKVYVDLPEGLLDIYV
ncbi:MAG: ribosome maturation factor RimM, partial [Ferruginibacter sp.]